MLMVIPKAANKVPTITDPRHINSRLSSFAFQKQCDGFVAECGKRCKPSTKSGSYRIPNPVVYNQTLMKPKQSTKQSRAAHINEPRPGWSCNFSFHKTVDPRSEQKSHSCSKGSS